MIAMRHQVQMFVHFVPAESAGTLLQDVADEFAPLPDGLDDFRLAARIGETTHDAIVNRPEEQFFVACP